MKLGPPAEMAAVLRRLLRYVGPYRLVLIPAMLATIGYALVTAAIVFFVEDASASFTDVLGGAEVGSLADAVEWPLKLVGLFLLRGIMDFSTVYGLGWVGRSAIRDLRGELFQKFLYLPAAYYDRHATGDLISKLTFNTEQIAEAVTNAFVIVVRDSLMVAVMIAIMIYFNWQLTLILAAVGPAVALLLRAMTRAFRRYSTRIQNSMGDVTRIAGQALAGQRVVKVFSGQEYETARFDDINRRNFRLNLRLVATRVVGDILTQLVVVVGLAVILFFVISGLLTEDIDSPEFLAFFTAVAILLTALKRLVNSNATMQRGLAAAEGLFEVLDQQAEHVEGDAAARQSGPAARHDDLLARHGADSGGEGVPAGRVAGALEFRDVSFRYGQDHQDVLRHLSFALEPGRTLAIVGRSGSGKSTLVGLLPRFYDVTGGAILLDGKDLRDYPLGRLRRQFSVVSQDVVIFDDTIAGNIAYGALAHATRGEIERAAEAAHVDDFAAALPRGLDTEVGEGGALLSGGQRQRIAIARAVLKDAPVLILDEATSALDSESERAVQAALAELMRGRTTLVIAHRLSTVERADRIIVMRDGRIVETGSHRELLAAGGDYASLYRLQFAD